MTSALRWDRPHVDPTTRTPWRPDEIGAEPVQARWPGECIECGSPFQSGDWIQRNFDHGRKVNNKKVYQHLMCP